MPRSSRTGWARSTTPPRFDRAEFPEARALRRGGAPRGERTTATSRGSCSTGSGSSAPTSARKSVLLKPNLVEFVKGASINTDPRMVVAAANALRRLGASSVVVAEGPGHRRDTEAIAFASGLRDALDDAGLPVRRPQRRAARADAARDPLHGARASSGCRRILRETEVVVSMPKLKTHHWVGRHDVAEELLRLHARPRLRLAEGRLPRARHPGVDPRHPAAVRPSLAIVDGIVGMQGDGPIMGDPVARAWSSSRATSSPPTSPARA